MRAIIVAGILLILTGSARADAIRVLGWANDGHAVIEIEGKELQRCAPTEVTAESSSCKRCGAAGADAATACGLTTKAVAGLASADKKLVLKKGAKRITQQSDGGDYWLWFDFPGYPSVLFTLASGYPARPTSESYFRADGGAVALHFKAIDHEKSRADDVRVIDVARLHARADAPAAVRALVTAQLDKLSSPTWATTSAVFATDEASRGAIDASGLGAALNATGSIKPTTIDVALTPSGVAAFVTITASIDKVTWRATELATYTSGGWKIAGGFWSRGITDTDVHAKAAAGQLPKVSSIAAKDRLGELAEWIDHVRTGDRELGPLGSIKRRDTITIGTQPKERVAGGKLLDAALVRWRKDGFKVSVAIAEAVPHAGWLLFDIELTKMKAGKTYTIPVRAWLAVERDEGLEGFGSGPSRGVVIAHFAVPR